MNEYVYYYQELHLRLYASPRVHRRMEVARSNASPLPLLLLAPPVRDTQGTEEQKRLFFPPPPTQRDSNELGLLLEEGWLLCAINSSGKSGICIARIFSLWF